MQYINKEAERSLISKQGFNFTLELEFVKDKKIIYIKFDGLPFDIREYVMNQKDFDRDKFKRFRSKCDCLDAFFYPEQDFYKLLENY